MNRGTNLRSIDTRYGPAIFPSGGQSELLDSFSYSELKDNEDCPSGSPCDHCIERNGLIFPTGVDGGHFDRQKKWKKLPLFKGGGSKSGQGKIINHTFIGYEDTTTTCGSRQRAMRPWLNPDFTPYNQMINPTFLDQSIDAMTHMGDPARGWANPEDCVEFPCTGPQNVVMRMEGVSIRASRRMSDEDRRRL